MPELKVPQEVLCRELVEGSSRIKRYLSRHTADASEAADFYQESIARVLEQAREQPIRNPVAYAIRVARNLIINRPAPGYDDEREVACPGPSPEEGASYAQHVELLTRALESMPPLRRSVFIRRRLHGDSRATIARDLEISEEAVKKHISRALCDLQRLLDGEI